MATLKDVARESGLTVGTVSRVLNNRGYISEQTRAKVYEVMKQLNYQPNEMARSLSKQTSNTIGLIVPHIMHPYFAKLISCIEAAAYENKFKILVFNSKGKEEREDEYIEMCKSNRVAGIILCSARLRTEKFKELGCPLITIERSMDEATAGVECDNYQGGVLATRHLIDRGCTHLLHIGGVHNQQMPADERKRAFEDVCRRAGVHCDWVDPDAAQYADMNYYQLINSVLEQYPETDGIFASSDVIAAQTIQVCHKKGIRVPEELRIVGFDDVMIAELTSPGITTVRQPVREMAETAVNMMVQAVNGTLVPARSLFPVSLIVRETT